MKKALLTSNNASIKQANKRKYIKGGAAKYRFDIDNTTNSNNIIKIIATNSADSEKESNITYFTKRKDRNLNENDIEDIKDKTLNIITANLTETNYYATIGNITDYNKFIYNINLFDTCVIVKLSNDNIYMFLKVEKKSSNIALTSFDTYQTNENNISQTDATMIKKFKSLGLDIDFVNKFVAGVKGYIDGQKDKINDIINIKKGEAAVKIQALARGNKERTRRKKEKEKKEKEEAAVKIQALARGTRSGCAGKKKKRKRRRRNEKST